MKNKTTTSAQKLLGFTLLVILGLVLGTEVAAGQSSAPAKPIVIKTELESGWQLLIYSTAELTNATVTYHASGFLNSTDASVPVNDCSQMANAVEAAVAVLTSDKKIAEERFGDVTVGIGVDEGHKVVTITGRIPLGMFSSPLMQKLPVAEASQFAQSLRAAPLIHARLMSAIDFGAIWKTR